MNDQERREDERLTRLLASVHAEAEPALWTRARARIEARERQPHWLAWAMRPAALGAAFTLLAVSVAMSFALFATAPRTVTASAATVASEDLADALVAEVDQSSTDVTPAPAATTPASLAPGDSGGTR